MLRTARNFRFDVIREPNPLPSRTLQSQKDDADINTIIKRFNVTGLLPQVTAPPVLADFSEVFDYQSAMNLIVAAKNSFAALPAEVRSRFDNDPEKYVAFCSDEKNLDEMRKMGIANPEAPVVKREPMEVRVVKDSDDGGEGNGE